MVKGNTCGGGVLFCRILSKPARNISQNADEGKAIQISERHGLHFCNNDMVLNICHKESCNNIITMTCNHEMLTQ